MLVPYREAAVARRVLPVTSPITSDHKYVARETFRGPNWHPLPISLWKRRSPPIPRLLMGAVPAHAAGARVCALSAVPGGTQTWSFMGPSENWFFCATMFKPYLHALRGKHAKREVTCGRSV